MAREAFAYRSLLPHLDVSTPTCHGVIDDPLGPTFVLKDLSQRRIVDQLDGLSIDEAITVAEALGRLHASASAASVVAAAAHDTLPSNTLHPNTLPRTPCPRTSCVRTPWHRSIRPPSVSV